MDKVMLYLFESSLILASLYLLYVLALKKETFFNLNRFFLLAILICSLAFPFISVDFSSSGVKAIYGPAYEFNQIRLSYHDVFKELSFERGELVQPDGHALSEESFFVGHGWRSALIYAFIALYISGVVFCLSKMAWSFWRIRRLIRKYPHRDMNGVTLVKVSNSVAPFSFMKYAFVSDELTNSPSFDQILQHEAVHVHQLHTLDLIFVQVCAAFFWFNPVIWFLVRSLKTVHEYIADRKIIDSGYSIVDYQTVLLDQLINNHSYEVVHNFNLSSIKKRLAMMSIPKSGLTGKIRSALTIAGAMTFSVLVIQCNAVLENRYVTEEPISWAIADEDLKSPGSKTISTKANIDERIVIVNIGEHSRASIAEMVNIINGMNPKVVGMDAFFISPRDEKTDLLLSEALTSTKNLVMAGRLKDGEITTSNKSFIEGSELNFANLAVSSNNQQVEAFKPVMNVNGENVYAFAMEIARLYNPKSIKAYVDRGLTKIDYTCNALIGTNESNEGFLTIEGDAILERNVEHSIEGKVVLLGFLGKYLGQPGVKEDRFFSPLRNSPSDGMPDMFGVVIHANIISQILDGR